MNWELLIRLAGLGLLLIAIANFIVPGMLDYRANLAKVDRGFGQIFKVHAAYTIVTVLGMAALCLWQPAFFLEEGPGRAVAGFIGLFWASRFVVQLFYYDRSLRARYPVWDLVFLAGFFSLGAGFLAIATLP
jgi:hypothetical protein